MTAPRSVLFACNMNVIRSPMAASLLRAHSGGRMAASSVGVRSGGEDPFVAAVLSEIGLDLGGHRPNDFDALTDLDFDLIVSLTPEAHERAAALAGAAGVPAEYWPTVDPTQEEGSRERRLLVYRELRDQLSRRIVERFPGVSTFPR